MSNRLAFLSIPIHTRNEFLKLNEFFLTHLANQKSNTLNNLAKIVISKRHQFIENKKHKNVLTGGGVGALGACHGHAFLPESPKPDRNISNILSGKRNNNSNII